MCGIVGTVRIGDADVVARMTAMLRHRGPDDTGYWQSGDVCFGHRRLSILDLSSAGHQPMSRGDATITYNGEIYNHLELREELAANGHRFETGTDTETLLVAYQQWGLEFLERIEGIFAFGLWDERTGTLLLARDRSGVKPLFYHTRDGGLAFASELKVMRLLPDFESRVNPAALRSALRFASNIEYESMLATVHKVRPGERVLWKDGKLERQPYWSYPQPNTREWNEDDLADELRERLSRVVRSQMLSDAPLGAALSGGLDSSGIVALMAQSGETVDTFTVGHGADDPDLLNARHVVDHYPNIRHHEIMVEHGDVEQLVPQVMWYLEEPLGQMESVQMFLNYKKAAEHVKVLLIGEGADELFAGYDRYRLFNPKLRMPMGLRRDLYERVYMYADRQPQGLAGKLVSRGMWGRLATSPLLEVPPRQSGPAFNDAGCDRALEQALNHDQQTYLHHLSLKRADAMGMAHSLELRVPFLGREIVELAAQIPAGMMLKGGVEKHILRRALEPTLPRTIIERRKRPFQMALNQGLENTLHTLCDRLLSPADVRARGFFDPARVDALRNGRPRSRSAIAHKVWSYRVWAMILCEVWARLFLDAPPDAGPPTSLDDIS